MLMCNKMMAVLVVMQHEEYDAASLEVLTLRIKTLEVLGIKTLEVLKINVVQ